MEGGVIFLIHDGGHGHLAHFGESENSNMTDSEA
jgi:hypothetical protein